MPVTAGLSDLNRDDLMRVLVEPRNAIVKQYEKLFELEKVKLVFPDETIEALADIALQKETGARGLRAILEESMMDVMFDIPSKTDIAECVITPGVVRNHEEPLLVFDTDTASGRDSGSKSASA
jgi:ATP-dependent Clp protease ATP-binding subunit ClpX